MLLTTVADTIDFLGGVDRVGQLTGVTSRMAVTIWRRNGRFPPRHRRVLETAVCEAGAQIETDLFEELPRHARATGR